MAENAVIDLRGSKVNIWRAGKGEPVLFLHGLQGRNGHEPGLDELAKSFEVIAPDHPGFGRSENVDGVDDINDLSLFYLDLMDALKLERVHVVGQCIGGWLALEMAIYWGQRFKSLSLVNSAGIRVKDVPRGDLFVCSEEDMIRMLFAGNGGVEWMKSIRGEGELEDIYERNRAAAAKYSWSPRLCNPKLDRWLHRVNAPVHIVWGEENRVLPPAYGEALKKLIPGASHATIANCAHLAHIEQPQKFAQEISQFIRRTGS